MYRFNKKTRLFSSHCNGCDQDIEFIIPKDLLDNKNGFPVAFRYVHGDPVHSYTVYVDRDFRIRGIESCDSMAFSKDLVMKIAENYKPHLDKTKNKETRQKDVNNFLRTMIYSFITILKVGSHENKGDEDKLFSVGKILGEFYADYFKVENEEELLNELVVFWQDMDLGKIQDINRENGSITFNIFDCYECYYLPNIGRTVCRLDEGFIKALFEKKFNQSYSVRETRCYAAGDDCCSFSIKYNNSQYNSMKSANI